MLTSGLQSERSNHSLTYFSTRLVLRKIFIIDIDGCICEHVDNEHPELMSSAQPYPDSIAKINQWYDQGHFICFFTARTEDHREATLTWLQKYGVKHHKLIMSKPRRKEGHE